MIPYPAYKSTNLPWLPKIPEHWECSRIKNLFSLRDERNYEDLSKVNLISVYTNLGVVQHCDIIETTGNRAVNADGYKRVYRGDIVVNIILCWMGAMGKSNFDGVTSPAYDVYRPKANISVDYYHFLFRTNAFCGECKRQGHGIMMMRWRTYSKDFLTIPIPLPPSNEQEQIVRYLDSMTAKINKLIRAKKKQIALLQEQRQAIINNAVTRGLDPNAEMKDSGIDWLGKIPKHWNIKAFSKVASIKTNLVDPKLYGDYLQISPDKIEKNTGKLVNLKTVKESGVISNNHLFYKGQIIYSKIRPLLNKATIAPFDGLCSADMYPIETKLNTDYLLLYMLSPLFLYQIKQSGDRVKMPKINQEEMAKLLVIIPSPTEQKAISLAVHEKWDQIDNAIAHFNDTILLLNEYKNSLISSVVTGQTDVRNIPVEDVIPDDLIPEDDSTSEIEEEPSNDESEE